MRVWPARLLSVGMPFRYVIPSFDVYNMANEMRKMKGYTTDGEVDYIPCGWLSEMEQL